MKIHTDRFGTLEQDSSELIAFPAGVIGFSEEKQFVLIQHSDTGMIGWLQSTSRPELAFPVVSAHALAPRYPDVSVESAARQMGLELSVDDFALLVVLSVGAGQPATVNLLAPIVIDTRTRTGAQVLLEHTSFTTREIFVLPTAPAPALVSEPRASSASAAQP